MKKAVFSIISMAVAMAFVAGCFTKATAYTERTNTDGTITVSHVSIIGTGDKVSQIAADGLFADGTDEDLGAGVKKASASQQSTGIGETLSGVGVLIGNIAKLTAASQGVPVGASDTAPASAVAVETATASSNLGVDAESNALPETAYSSEGYGASPGDGGVGVYGRPSCSRCRAYKAAHPETAIVNIDDSANRTAMWAALKRLGYTGSSVSLPVYVSESAYVAPAK